MQTRELLISDYDEVIALWNEAEGVDISEGDSREEVRSYLARNAGLSRVACDGEHVVAAALCGHDGRRGWIYHLAVARTHRGRGIGRRIIGECLAGLRVAGIARAIILVAGDNPAGRAFWLGNGWEEIDGAIAMSIDL
jgi:ribosomal protein S18 acetylase RimI-like enzyme